MFFIYGFFDILNDALSHQVNDCFSKNDLRLSYWTIPITLHPNEYSVRIINGKKGVFYF